MGGGTELGVAPVWVAGHISETWDVSLVVIPSRPSLILGMFGPGNLKSQV